MFWFLLTTVGLLETNFIKETFADFSPITATQSGNYNPPTNALLAIDRNPSTCAVAAEDNVTIRDSGSVYGWLQGDLGNPFLVISVTLTNTNTSAYETRYLQNFVVLVSNTNTTEVQASTTCYTFNTGSPVGGGSQITLTCNPNPLIGRYITIKRQGGFRQDAISLCEVTATLQPSGVTSTTISSTITTTTPTKPITTTASVSSKSKTSTVSSSSPPSPVSTSSTSVAVSSSPSSSSASIKSSSAVYSSFSASTRSEITWSASTTPERLSNSSSFSSISATAKRDSDSSELDHLKAQNGGLTIAVIVLGVIMGLTIIAIILFIIIVICRRRKRSKMKMLRRAEKRTPVEPDVAAAATAETAIDPPKANNYEIFRSFNRDTLFYENDDDLMSETTDKATNRDTRRRTTDDIIYEDLHM